MAKIEKHGNKWRIRVSLGYHDGKQITKTVSGDTQAEVRKKEAELKLAYSREEHKPTKITLADAVEAFINMMEGTYSPETTRGDRKVLRTHIMPDRIASLTLDKVTQKELQEWVAREVKKGTGHKTLKNTHSLITRSLKTNGYNSVFHTRFPQPKPFEAYMPTEDEMRKVVAYLKEHDTNLLLAAVLSSSGTMRRSEVCAIEVEDIGEGTARVNKAMKKDNNGNWAVMLTKNVHSVRTVHTIPDWIKEYFPPSGRIVRYNPAQVTTYWERTMKKIDVPYFRFQDLRAFSASFLIACGMDPVTVRDEGGWHNFTTPNKHYLRRVQKEDDERFTKAREAMASLNSNAQDSDISKQRPAMTNNDQESRQ